MFATFLCCRFYPEFELIFCFGLGYSILNNSMATRQSARIRARKQQNCEEVEPQTSNNVVAPTLKACCLCRLPEDGHFMICCDHFDEWYHGDCVGITPDIGQEMKNDNMEYICLSYTSDTTLVSSASVSPPTSSVINPCKPCVDFQCVDKDGKTYCKLIGCAFEVMVHWRRNSFYFPLLKLARTLF